MLEKSNIENLKEINLVKKNPFETLNINLNFKDKESTPLVKIGEHKIKGELIAGGNNSPNIYAPFNCIIKDIKKIRIENNNIVSTHIELIRDFTESTFLKNNTNSINNPIDFLIEIEKKGVVNCQENSDIFSELCKKIGKIKNLTLNFYDTDEYTFTLKYLFTKKANEIVETIIFLNKIFNFEDINIIYDFNCDDSVKYYNELLNKNKIFNVKFLPIKNRANYVIGLKLKLKTLFLNTKFLAKQKNLYFDGKTFFDIYLSCKQNQNITSTYITINGDAIKNCGIYKVPLGVSIKELIEIAETKNTYDYIDNYFYNAMEAYNDKLSFEKEIEEEKDEVKKQKLINLMQDKEKEAQLLIYDKMEETRSYYNKCLGLVYEVIGHTQKGVYSHINVISQSTSALIMVTRDTRKKL